MVLSPLFASVESDAFAGTGGQGTGEEEEMKEELSQIVAITCLAGLALVSIVVGAVDVLVKGKKDWAPHLLLGFGLALLVWTLRTLIEMWG
jgi:hypothetical protein